MARLGRGTITPDRRRPLPRPTPLYAGGKFGFSKKATGDKRKNPIRKLVLRNEDELPLNHRQYGSSCLENAEPWYLLDRSNWFSDC